MKVIPEGSFIGHAGSLPDTYRGRHKEIDDLIEEIEAEDKKHAEISNWVEDIKPETPPEVEVWEEIKEPLLPKKKPIPIIIEKSASSAKNSQEEEKEEAQKPTKNKHRLPRIRKVKAIAGKKNVKVTWDVWPREEFTGIKYIIQWKMKQDSKVWKRGESEKCVYIIRKLVPEKEYLVKVSALWEKIVSPPEHTEVMTLEIPKIEIPVEDDEVSDKSSEYSVDEFGEWHKKIKVKETPKPTFVYAQRKLAVILCNSFNKSEKCELAINLRDIFDFFDKTLMFKTVVKLENQPKEKIRRWFKALDRNKMFDGFQMFVCVICGFGNYQGFQGVDGEMIFLNEIYKYTKDKFSDKPKLFLIDILHQQKQTVRAMKSADIKVHENSSREVVLEWVPPKFNESDKVFYHVELFRGLQKIFEVFQSGIRHVFDKLEPDTLYRFNVTPVQGPDRKPYGSPVYAKLKTKSKDADTNEVRHVCAQRLSEHEIIAFWEPPDIPKTAHLTYVVTWANQVNQAKRAVKETAKTSIFLNGIESNVEQVVKIAIKAYGRTHFPVTTNVPSFNDTVRATDVTAIAESHAVFWVDWQFRSDLQDNIKHFNILCSENLSFKEGKTDSYEVPKESRTHSIQYKADPAYFYVKVVPVGNSADDIAVLSAITARIETDRAMRLFASCKTSSTCEVLWWVEPQHRDKLSVYYAHCRCEDPNKKKFKPVTLKLSPDTRQLHEIRNLESNTTYFISIYRRRFVYTQEVKVKTLPKNNPENLHVDIISAFEVKISWSTSGPASANKNANEVKDEKKGKTQNDKFVIEYHCDPAILKKVFRKETAESSIHLTELLPDTLYYLSVKRAASGDPSELQFRTPKFGPRNLEYQVTLNGISMTWQDPPKLNNDQSTLNHQIVLDREDGKSFKGKVMEDASKKRYTCEFKGLWSSTSYTIKCYTLLNGKRKYSPLVVQVKTKSDPIRSLIEPKGDNYIVSFASYAPKSTSSPETLPSAGLYLSNLFTFFQSGYKSRTIGELLEDGGRKKLESYTVTNVNYASDKWMLLEPPKAEKET